MKIAQRYRKASSKTHEIQVETEGCTVLCKAELYHEPGEPPHTIVGDGYYPGSDDQYEWIAVRVVSVTGWCAVSRGYAYERQRDGRDIWELWDAAVLRELQSNPSRYESQAL